jgi:hypothetical protein
MIIVNETSTPVDSSQNIKILAPASPGASTHFIIDVIGFYY